MKRNLLRVAALTVVVGLGAVAIIYAQRSPGKPALGSESEPAANAAADPPPKVVLPSDGLSNPLRGRTSRAAAGDPLAFPATSTKPKNDTAVVLAGAGDAIAAGNAANRSLMPPDPMPGQRSADPLANVPAGMPTDRGVPPPVALPSPPRGVAAGSPAPYAPPGVARGTNNAPSMPPDVSTDAGPAMVAAAPPTDLAAADPPPGATPRSLPSASDRDEPKPLRVDPFGGPPQPVRTVNSPATGPGLNPPSTRSNDTTQPYPSSSPSPGDRFAASGRTVAAGGVPPTAPAESDPGSEGSGRPGSKNLEGPQSPQVTIQKFAPPEIQVGKTATFRISVRNTGTVTANGVEVHDQVPKGARVLGCTPKSSRGVNGELLWTLGTIKPGEEVNLEEQLMPISEGEIGSVATVQFAAEAAVRTVATKPQLVVEAAMPERVQIGEQVLMKITISNPGTGVATGVVIEDHLPPGLQHPAGTDLEYEIGQLRPGESRKLDLTMTAVRPGPMTNILGVRGDGNLRAEDRRNLEVTAPQLAVNIEGPKKRYLEREATYQIAINNPGTAPAEHIDLVAQLPTGLKFVSANNAGQYDGATHTVHWRLEELPVHETGEVQLVTMPTEAGQQSLKVHSAAERGVSAEKEQPVLIDGIAAILVQTGDTTDPVEVGGQTTYEIRIVNQGSKAAANLRTTVTLPPELKPLAAEGPSRYAIDANHVTFDALPRLAAKADVTYRVRVQAVRAGDLRTRVQVVTDDMQSPVTNEESTRVFADE